MAPVIARVSPVDTATEPNVWRFFGRRPIVPTQ
jgi:hypothetical protein